MYSQLTQKDRCHIEAGLASNLSYTEIASKIEKHSSSVSREIRRNSINGVYKADIANNINKNRRLASKRTTVKLQGDLLDKVKSMLCEYKSPEQISGRLKTHENIFISYETIYKWIWADKKQGGEWYKYLRHNNKKYHNRGHKKKKRSIIPDKLCISQRPMKAEEKSEIGHLEMDLIEGKKGTGFIISMVDRKAKYTKLQKVMTKEAHEVRCGIQDKLMPLKGVIKTKTYDNGREFTNHKMAADALGVKSYFARPYCSWQRGLNEHTNGLVRQFFPKGMSFTELTDEDIQRVEDLLNNRPRKILGYKTPAEVFFSEAFQ